MKFSKLTKPELEEILKNANFTDEEAEVFELLVADKSLEEVSRASRTSLHWQSLHQQQLKHLTMCLWQQMYGFLADAVRPFLSRIHLHRLSVLQMLASQ